MDEGKWRNDVDSKLAHIESRLSHMETKNAVDDVHRANVEKRLSGIEDTLRWLVRLIIAALITAVVAYITGGGLALA